MVRCIHDNLQEMIEETREEPEPLELDKFNMKRLLERSGASEEKLEKVETTFEQTAGERQSLMATNVAETKKFSIQTPDVLIKVSPDRADLVETRMIDDRKCIVIAISDQVEVNGVDINLGKEEQQ